MNDRVKTNGKALNRAERKPAAAASPPGKTITPGQRLYRRATTARILGCHVSLVKRLEQEGKLTPVRLLGPRGHVFHHVEQVEALTRGRRGRR
jgi:hypothetical protein